MTGKHTTKPWIPLESNPEVLNDFAQKLGVKNIPNKYRFCDIYGLDEELLCMVPTPVLAVILLFPISETTEALRKAEEDRMSKLGTASPLQSLFYMKQTIGNACGTIGLLHSVANSMPPLQLHDGSFLQTFFSATRGMNPEQRGKYLEQPPSDAPSMDSIHEEAAKQGATEAPPADADIDLHFVAFVEVDGRLWELDGRKSGPIDHGMSSEATLLKDVAAVVKENFVNRANSLNFSLIALAGVGGDDVESL